MAIRPPRLPRNPPLHSNIAGEPADNVPENPVLRGHQHLVYDILSGRQVQGYQINHQAHLSSNTKLAALAFIAAESRGDYMTRNRAALRDMMSRSHNDATIVQVARVMQHPSLGFFNSHYRGLQRGAQGQQLNVVADADREISRQFFDDYRTALQRHATEFGIEGARISDTSGRAEPGLHNGTSEGSPLHVAGLVRYLYNRDNGQTLTDLLNPRNEGHTTAPYLRGRTRPGNGQVLFAKTGSIAAHEYGMLPSDSPVRRDFPNGVYVLTIGYMHEGRPMMAFLRAGSAEERARLANQFLDSVAGNDPRHNTQRRTEHRPTTTV